MVTAKPAQQKRDQIDDQTPAPSSNPHHIARATKSMIMLKRFTSMTFKIWCV